MILNYLRWAIFVHGFSYQLGDVCRDLDRLKSDNVLANEVKTLAAMGYRYCLSLGDDKTLMDLARGPVTAALERAKEPRALVFQHCHAENAVLPTEPGDKIGATRNYYFPIEVMRELKVDHLP